MHLKGALHVHTTCSDGELKIEEVVQIYSSLGFDFIALTDHDYLLNSKKNCYDSINKIQSDLIIFKGIELTVYERGYVHVNKIYGDKEILHIFNHPSELYLPIEKVIDRIKSISLQYPIDAVEITTRGYPQREYDIPEISYPKVATDDSHTKHGCGVAWIEMDCHRNKDAIIKAIKNGNFWNCYA
ncbi:MAG: PHP domain-containing protein [Desulfobacterales bacterium]|nr:PHP domain-containing protein [Desulfobacterales bacterium]